jgi:glycosyltransferase involved in cell wall biosynthesis
MLGITDRVKFAGFRPDARRLLGAMDLFVLSSRSEGLSVGLLEAMAEGVPVAVTDVGANLEVIENGKAGIVLPADEAEWPAILAHAVRHAEPVKVSCAAERVRGRYAIDQTVDAYETLYGAE